MAIILFYVIFSYLQVDYSSAEKCSPPVRPLNGFYKETRSGYLPNDEIKYFCNNGTYLYGPNIRRCLNNGSWNATSPYCAFPIVRKFYYETGKVVLNLADRNYSTCVTYEENMKLNFHYNGKSNAGIILRLVWKDTKGNVYRYVIARGTTLKKKGKYISNSFASDEYEWSLNTNNNYSFTIAITDFTKRKPPELCEIEIFTERDDKCPELSIPNGVVSYKSHNGTQTYGNAAQVTCKKGYKISGGESSRKGIHYCSDGGLWTGGNSSCEVVQCEQLRDVKNGRIQFNTRNYLGVSRLHCDEGYIAIVNTQVICQSDGKWAEHNFTCNLIDCETLYDVKNGNISYTNTTLNGVATLRCNVGYHITDDKNSTCLNNASWSYANFECKQVRCNKFPKFKNAIQWSKEKKSLDNATVGTKARLQCSPGYTKTPGQLYIECLPSGKWSTTNVTCKKATYKEVVVIAATVGAVSSAIVFACCFICSVLFRRRLKRRQQTDARLPLNEIVERRVSSEKHEYSVVVYEEIRDVRKKKPTSPLPKIPSGENEFNYSLPFDQRKGSCMCSRSDIYVVPDDAYKTECSSVQTRTSLKRRNSSADSNYWRRDSDRLGNIYTLDTPKVRKVGSNTSLPDFPANTFSLYDNDLYSSD